MTNYEVQNEQEIVENTTEIQQTPEKTPEKPDFSSELSEIKNAINVLNERIADRGEKIEKAVEAPIVKSADPEVSKLMETLSAQQKVIEELKSKVDSKYDNKIPSLDDFVVSPKKEDQPYEAIVARDTEYIKYLTAKNRGN